MRGFGVIEISVSQHKRVVLDAD